MTPDEFQKRILPPIFSAWEERCFCRNHSFLKLVSFDFEDYGIGPLALMDSEIVIQAIIGRRFLREERRATSRVAAPKYIAVRSAAHVAD